MEPNQTIQNTKEGMEIHWNGYLTVPFIKEWSTYSNQWENIKGKKIFLHLNGIERIDSSGIQLLVYLKKRCQANQQILSLTNHSLPVLKVLDLLGLVSFFGDRIKVKKEHANEVEFRYGTRKVS
ncbi:STAS domain-containing protein [Leptospira levettii]|uniref:STAS domain-containing protein n=1 Tax=Leptospira levettii TaxID=2023178 RepID=UPI00223CA85E|nr:STAS domain-containing protein [Leptospira levettii]MCW7472509.1 STAS domain-containing protein [Leptospira levettii]